MPMAEKYLEMEKLYFDKQNWYLLLKSKYPFIKIFVAKGVSVTRAWSTRGN